MKRPPGFSERRQRRNECLPTASTMTSYVSPFLGEVLLLVVDDLVGPERPDDLDVLRVAHGGDVGAEVLGELHRCGADCSGGAVDRDPLPLAQLRLPQARERDDRSIRDGRGLFEAQARRHVRQRTLLPHADVLGVCARAHAEDLVSHVELADGCTDRLDDAGQLHAADPVLRPAKAREEAREERVGRPVSAVGSGDGRGVHLDEDLVLLRLGPLDLLESQDLRRPVSVVDDRSHATSPRPFSVSTTFPVFCPVSTYFAASTTSSSGYRRSMTTWYFPASTSSLRKRTSSFE